METQKRSKKKMLKNLINDSMREAISHLELPEPSKKAKKLIDRSSKKLAGVFSEMLKKEDKKRKKAEKLLHAAVNGDGKKKKRKMDSIDIGEPIKL
jgi:hypothetical protein